MESFLQRLTVIAAFSLLIALVITNAILTRHQLYLQIEDHLWAIHSREVQIAIQETQTLLVDAETGQRGFLYTGDEKYLNPYNDSIARVEQHIDRLRRITADDPVQQHHIAVLSELTTLKLQEMASALALHRAGKAADARSLMLSDRGLLIMNDIRAEINRMSNEEDTVEKRRDADYRSSVLRSIISLYSATIISTLGLALLAYFILHERRLRDRHASQIRDREEQFRVTLTSIGDAVIATDARGRVTFINPIATDLTGISESEAIGQHIAQVFPIVNESTGEPADNPVIHVMRSNGTASLANRSALRHRSGRLIPIEDSAAPIRNDRGATVGVVLVFHDVTADRAAQEVLRKTEKLAAAARLSATVAHEINNPLEAVTNLIFLSSTSPDLPANVRQHLALAEQELDRVAHITRQTLGFYRESNQPEVVALPTVVEAVVNLYRNKIQGKRLRIERVFDACPPVWGNPGELRQVVSNLLSNAIDAAPPEGHIILRTATVATPEGTRAEFVVEDSGTGIDSANREAIFDAFFTTKKDVGTGLGLWVSKEIVARHHGTLELRGHGTLPGACFAVSLPAHTPQS
ncbi:MAG: CHASE3 domain-containing protein [Terracidiphilus sp.]|nr:CHASE3 domain-containing protein [Terracidiphilus sp.]